MNSKLLMMFLLLACTTEGFVDSHILVGRDADFYKDGLPNEGKLRMREFKFRKTQPNRECEKQLSKKMRRVIAAIVAEAFNKCDDEQTLD